MLAGMEASIRWVEPIPLIFANGWWQRLRPVAFRVIGQRRRFGVGVSTAIRSRVERLRNTGSVEPDKIGGYKPRAIAGEHRTLAAGADQGEGLHSARAGGRVAERGLKVDYRSVWTFVHDEKLSFAKKRGGWRKRDRPDVARRRAQWIKYQDRVDPARLVFIDETWTRTNMAPLRGWAPREATPDRQGSGRLLEDNDVPGRTSA